jgi:hypothetical protein
MGLVRRKLARAALAAALLVASFPPARADAGWFEAGDSSFRNDLLLLNDSEVITLPVSHWPLPREAVRYALENAKDHHATNSSVELALARVRARIAVPAPGFSLETRVAGGQGGLWRDFDTFAREDAEGGARVTFDSEHFSAGLGLLAVQDPDDGQELRADGSHGTVKLGNWLLSANTLDRWWGPSHEGSLILSSNARPMPTLMVERAAAKPFETAWLSWLGPWRFNFGISRMESRRDDIDSPLFMAWRVVVMPSRKIELGFSRTAQFCGEQLECNLDTFGNMLAGNDNVGFDADPESEPGNQMAGFDIRWTSPLFDLPYAVYAQMIGEDESGYLPAKYLNQFGFEAWKPLADGGLIQVHAEYASTTCSANSNSGPYYNCAYNQGRFNVEGYRHRGRSIGHTTDRDAESYVLGGSFTEADGTWWSLTARTARLNRDDIGDVRNTVASVPTNYDSLEAGWRGRLFGERLSVELGVESIEPAGGERDVEPFGFISWHHVFAP